MQPQKLKKSNKWPYILLPILVIILFILFVQNAYLKGIDNTRTEQIQQLQKSLNEAKGQLNDIQRQQKDNGDKIDGLDDRGDATNAAPGAYQQGTANPNQPVAGNTRPNQQSSTAGPQAPQQQSPVPVTPAPTTPTPTPPSNPRPNPDTNPTLLCNPLLPLICG